MQSFFVNVYEKIKSMLCERRNSAPVINPFAVMQRTDIMVRKQSPQVIQQNAKLLEELKQINLPKKPPSQQQPAYPRLSSSLNPPPSQHLPSLYKVQLINLEDETQSQQQTLEYQVISESCETMKIVSQINKNYENLIGLMEKDQTRKKQFWKNIYLPESGQQLSEEILQYRDEAQQSKQDQQLDENVIKKMYDRDITDVRQFKYSYELSDYPQIDLQAYKNIRQLWSIGRKNPNYLIKNMNLKMLEKLIARSFKTLSFGCWLNDQIINGYLQMLEVRVSQEGSKYKILNSFFAQTTFAKSQEIVQRTLKRRNITRDNILVIAINNGTHWFFARIINSMIEVFDSIPKDPLYYTSSEATCEIFTNIMKFADWFYQTKHEITVVERYPRQQNSYDCGMFLLCGIKDIVRNYPEWSFNQGDISYKRILVGKQILDGYVQGF